MIYLAISFKDVTNITIPQGTVTKITDSNSTILWQKKSSSGSTTTYYCCVNNVYNYYGNNPAPASVITPRGYILALSSIYRYLIPPNTTRSVGFYLCSPTGALATLSKGSITRAATYYSDTPMTTCSALTVSTNIAKCSITSKSVKGSPMSYDFPYDLYKVTLTYNSGGTVTFQVGIGVYNI